MAEHTAKDKEARESNMEHMAEQAAARERETAGVVEATDAAGQPIAGDVAMPDDDGKSKYRKCPVAGCTERCEVYEGDNEHKAGTMACPVHGRMAVKKA